MMFESNISMAGDFYGGSTRLTFRGQKFMRYVIVKIALGEHDVDKRYMIN